MYSSTVYTGTSTPSYLLCKKMEYGFRDGRITYIFGKNNGWITALATKLCDVLVRFGELLTDATRDGILEDLAVHTLEATGHAMDLAPQRNILIPAQRAGNAK